MSSHKNKCLKPLEILDMSYNIFHLLFVNNILLQKADQFMFLPQNWLKNENKNYNKNMQTF